MAMTTAVPVEAEGAVSNLGALLHGEAGAKEYVGIVCLIIRGEAMSWEDGTVGDAGSLIALSGILGASTFLWWIVVDGIIVAVVKFIRLPFGVEEEGGERRGRGREAGGDVSLVVGEFQKVEFDVMESVALTRLHEGSDADVNCMENLCEEGAVETLAGDVSTMVVCAVGDPGFDGGG